MDKDRKMQIFKQDEINSNIVSEEDYKEIAEKTIDIIADTISKSLGYYGSTTVVEDNSAFNSFVTKDGFNILRNIKFDGTISSTILRFITKISQELVKEVGDGSTSSVVMSRKLFKILSNEIKEGRLTNYSRKEISDSLEKVKYIISEQIKEKSTEITEDNFDKLKSIASVSNNNDDKIGEMIYKIYKEVGKEGFIFSENSPTGKDYYEITEGLETSYGYEDKTFANDPNGFDLSFKEPYILMVDGHLEGEQHLDLMMATKIMERGFVKEGRPIVIVAHSFSKEFTNTIKNNVLANRHRGGQHALSSELLVTLTRFDSERGMEFQDLATFLGCEIVKRDFDDNDGFYNNYVKMLEEDRFDEFKARYLGSCEKVNMDSLSTQFIKGKGVGSEKMKSRIKLIDKEIDYIKNEKDIKKRDLDLYRLEKRKNNLLSRVARLYVGGTSESDITTRKFLIEDSIFACKSALKHGYVSGGNLAVSKAIKNINKEDLSGLDKVIMSILDEASKEVFHNILNNYNRYDEYEIEKIIEEMISEDIIFNLKKSSMEKDNSTDIINSADTDIKILNASISIIGLLVLSNQYLRNNPI